MALATAMWSGVSPAGHRELIEAPRERRTATTLNISRIRKGALKTIQQIVLKSVSFIQLHCTVDVSTFVLQKHP